MEKHLQTGLDNGKEMYLSLPHITRENPPEGYMEQVKKWLEAGLSGFLVRNLESYSALAQMGLVRQSVCWITPCIPGMMKPSVSGKIRESFEIQFPWS